MKLRLTRPVMIVMLATSGLVAANEPSPTDSSATTRSAQPLADGNSEFNQLDVDRDGWLSQQEAQADADDEGLVFADADRDGDGRLSSDEWARRFEDESTR